MEIAKRAIEGSSFPFVSQWFRYDLSLANYSFSIKCKLYHVIWLIMRKQSLIMRDQTLQQWGPWH